MASNLVAGLLGGVAGLTFNALMPKFDSINIEGPRMTTGDLFGSSSYGAAIPKTYGRVRLAGNLIWIGAVKETANTVSSGGGGFS